MKEKINSADMLLELGKVYSDFFDKEIEPKIKLTINNKKTEIIWGPETYEGIESLLTCNNEQYFCDELLVKEARCFYTGGGIWISEVPFEMCSGYYVFVMDSDNTGIWGVYKNPYKNNTKYDGVEYDELMIETGNLNELPERYQSHCIKAQSLLLERED